MRRAEAKGRRSSEAHARTGTGATATAAGRAAGGSKPARAHAESRSWTAIAIGLLVLAAVLPWLPALHDGFVFDDEGLIVNHPAVWSSSPRAAWTSPFWPDHPGTGLYRPVTTFSFWCDGRLFGHRPGGFHAVNLLLNLGAALILWRVLAKLFPARRREALATAALFALHPLHGEAVVSVVGRSELLAALFGLAAYLLALEFVAGSRPGKAAASAVAFGLALLSKESAAGLLLLPVYHLATEAPARPRWSRTLALWAVPLALVLLLRARVLGSLFALETVSVSDNVLAHVPALTRALTALGLSGSLALRLLVPWRLSADYSYPQVVPNAGWMLAGVAFLLVLAVAGYRAVTKRDRAVGWGLAAVLAGGLLTSNVIVPIGTVLGERLSYLPSAGAIWILVVLARRIPLAKGRAGRVGLTVFASLWLAGLAARSWARSQDWRSDVSLFTATVEASPRSAKARANLSTALLREGRVEDALRRSAEAIALFPDYRVAREARASALDQAGRPAEALEIFRSLAADDPRRAWNWLEMGNTDLELKRTAAADSCFRTAATLLPPGDPRVAIGTASVLAQQSRWPEASKAWHNAVALSPGDPGPLREWAFALWQTGAADSAATIYDEALAKAPADPDVGNDTAWFLTKSGRDPARGLMLARRAFTARPGKDTGGTLLEALLSVRGCEAARAWADSLRGTGSALGELPSEMKRRLEDRCGDRARSAK